ncbi:TAXI family TRAP transporter solute-binding subunit [Desulfuromonas sp. AOP6]|uniref:TAXI family TRAP transporter solute-binding subunit n=1 Tax=Desulfuromonas sp. AOP6 TaxID=1566351 RepID=UPI001277D56E|nr:TAXI family TRAP transporter solute-binding subunit [Desulfuromonas sp. AOP6]BCA80341.1 C4-dicarboxylate ABC transportersubstrate-binding protein [Desulfuromonas sp. AOP6]
MIKTARLMSLTLSALLVAAMTLVPNIGHAQKTRLAFSGGPDGGTFQYFSNGIATRLSKTIPNVEVSNMASAGSVENVRRVNSGEADFGIAYSGDTYLARTGQLPKDTRKYENVHALAYLYGAPAHLIVLDGSGINAVSDLAGKRVAVGGAGSGAAASAQRYFETLGLWDKMNVEFIGYSKAASALGDKLIDAMWVFAGFPNSSVIQAAASNKIKVLSLYEAGEKGGVFKKYPFYAPVTIPAGTYSGIDYDVKTFQDSALWVAGKHVDSNVIYQVTKDIFTPEGLSYLVKVKSTAKAMSVEGALTGIVTPVHEGAEKLWKEKGLALTPEQTAR